MEIWKDIPGLDGQYQISNLGRVRSLYMNHYRPVGIIERIDKIRILRGSDNGHGYKMIRLGKDRKPYYIHRLVAEAFIPNPENKTQVNHKDYDTSNNKVYNLEWVTPLENTRYSMIHMHTRKPRKENYYIVYKAKSNRYRVVIDRKEYSSYKTLEEAIKKRDEILNEKHITIK